ncbi:MAG: hypothetical protein ACLFV7_06050 [Phycisphaerae bacterium]
MQRTAIATLTLLLAGTMLAAEGLPDDYEGELKIQHWGKIEAFTPLKGSRPDWAVHDDDRLYRMYFLHGERDDQQAQLWVPGGVTTLRGVVVDLGWPYVAWQPYLQEFARANHYAVLSGMWRYARLPDVVAAALERFGKHIGHPELANAPWLTRGFSRMGFQSVRCALQKPQRVISCYVGGSPGPTLPIFGGKSRSKEQARRAMDIFRTTPVMFINGSNDAFVGRNSRTNTPYFAWANRNYPRLRAKDVAASYACEWGPGHGSFNNAPMLLAFWKKAIEARVPESADPARGPVKLKPFDRTQGYLVEVDYWGVTDEGKGTLVPDPLATRHLGEPVPYDEYDGKDKRTVWLPDLYTAAVWRAFVERPRGVHLDVSYDADRPDKRLALAIRNERDQSADEIRYYDGNILLGEGETLRTDKLSDPRGVHAVYAVVRIGDTVYRTQPVAICGGRILDQRGSQVTAKQASRPERILMLSEGPRRTLGDLEARSDANAPSRWKKVFEDDFSGGKLSDAWYEYYSTHKRLDKDRRLQMEIVDGTLQVGGNLQTVAMLKYNWPDDVAVEYRARSLAERHGDLSVVLSGNPGGTKFPWREGMMFQFGAHYNKATQFLIKEQPKATCDVLIRPNTWHTVRVERLGGKCTAIIDGKVACEIQLTPERMDSFFGQRIGFYVFGSTGQFDDVKVYVRAFKNPADVEPAMPSEKERLTLARGLVKLMTSPYREQRYQAWRTLRKQSFALLEAFRTMLAKDKVKDDRIRNTLKGMVDAARPD